MSKFTDDYYKNTKDLKPSPLLVEALGSMKSHGKVALDLGCGAGRDTKLLVEKGFHVTAVDSESAAKKYIDALESSPNQLIFIQNTFAEFDYKNYDLINARYSLPFSSPEDFIMVKDKILHSLNPGGVFVGQLFGVNDSWNGENPDMTFHTRSEVESLFSALEIIKLEEQDGEGVLASGAKKHWHVFNIIARQK